MKTATVRPLPSWERSIADALIQRRTELGLTRSNFAENFGVPLPLYKQWERGEALPKWGLAFTFLRMLGGESRERFNINLGELFHELYGDPLSERGRAFEGLSIVLEKAKSEDRAQWVKAIEDAAAAYTCRAVPVKQSAKKTVSGKGKKPVHTEETRKARALAAVEIVMDHANATDKQKWCQIMEDAAAKYGARMIAR